MESKTMFFVQVITTLAVILGLALVVYELRQSRQIANAQIVSDQYSTLMSYRSTLMGDSPSLSLEKACNSPELLTYEDMEVLNSFYWSIYLVVNREKAVADTGLLPNDERFKSIAGNMMPAILQTPYGEFWWSEAKRFVEVLNPEA